MMEIQIIVMEVKYQSQIEKHQIVNELTGDQKTQIICNKSLLKASM